jgi:hypothetical protein
MVEKFCIVISLKKYLNLLSSFMCICVCMWNASLQTWRPHHIFIYILFVGDNLSHVGATHAICCKAIVSTTCVYTGVLSVKN